MIRTRSIRLAVGAATVLAVTTTALQTNPVAAETVCGDPFTPIYEIQGAGSSSPFHGDVVTTEGVVTVDLQQSSEIQGFFLQDLTGDGDGATSDGIFVNHRDTWTPSIDVSVGDVVRITGDIDEQFGRTQFEFLDEGAVCGTAKFKPTKVDTRTFNDDAERFEGMYVKFPGNLYVTDTFNLHRFGEVWLASDGVVEQPTNEFPGGSTDMFEMADDGIAQSILLDDSSRFSNPNPVPHLTRGTLRLGDRTTNLTGGIHYDFGQYRVMAQDDVNFRPQNRRTDAPNVGGNVVVSSFNVLNYWTTLNGRGADTPDQLAVQTDKLVAAINGMDADIVGLQEVENDPNCGDPATPCSHTPTETLVDALNADLGADLWSWVGPVDHYNYYPIRNEIIYRNDRVSQVGSPVALADPAFDTFRDPGTPLTNDSQLGRPPIAQTFDVDGEVFTVMVNHFKSKGSSCSSISDPDAGDGQGNCNLTRVAQSQAVLDFTADLAASSGDPDVLVIGDLNSYLLEDPVLTLESELSNVVATYVEDPYSFNFFATFAAPFIGRGTLDHAFATGSLAGQVDNAKIWHINADEPRFLDWFDTSRVAPGPYRSSDHDPVLIGIELGE